MKVFYNGELKNKLMNRLIQIANILFNFNKICDHGSQAKALY